ncbi:MAG TPA: beta-phosphoglucomutase family hydrolase [Phototrophicaceae bacterium]|nr:beta-phosphoglucomutase family hydrolase [Phototrophicaceae bacterium]
MINLRALIFDLDGVIAETLWLHYESWRRLAEDENLPFTPQHYEGMLGLPRRACLPIFLQGRTVSEEIAQDLMRRKNDYFTELMERMTPADAAPGVADLIHEGRAAGLKIALGSSSQNARRVLTKLGLLDFFDVVGDGLTVERTKPAPDIYLWAAEHLGVQPAEAVVFEDSAAGVEAGLAGDFWVVGIGSPHLVGRAQVVVESLAGMTLASLRERLETAPM